MPHAAQTSMIWEGVSRCRAISDGCTKIDAPMIVPTTIAVALVMVRDRVRSGMARQRSHIPVLLEPPLVVARPDFARGNADDRRQDPRDRTGQAVEAQTDQPSRAEYEEGRVKRDPAAEHRPHVLVPPCHRRRV